MFRKGSATKRTGCTCPGSVHRTECLLRLELISRQARADRLTAIERDVLSPDDSPVLGAERVILGSIGPSRLLSGGIPGVVL